MTEKIVRAILTTKQRSCVLRAIQARRKDLNEYREHLLSLTDSDEMNYELVTTTMEIDTLAEATSALWRAV